MKLTGIICIFSFWSLTLLAQVNLVPNPSFEDTTSCPIFSGISYATGWFNSGASPDYYNWCANGNSPAFGVPSNWLGNQFAFHGNAYAGIVLWYVGSREFIGVQLTQMLIPGTEYFVSGYISRGDSSDASPFTCSSNNFSFRFSTVAYDYSQSNPAPVDNYSHVHAETIIPDNFGWTRISGSFIADSAYQFLTIGNFYGDANTDTAFCNYSLALAYYYVDAICVSTDSLTCLNWMEVNEYSEHWPKLYVHPNPSNGQLYIENLPQDKASPFSLRNIAGEIVNEGTLTTQLNQIDVSPLAKGVYVLQVNGQHLKVLITH